MNLIDLTIKEQHEGLKDKEFSVTDLLAAYKKQVEATEEKIKSFLTLDWDRAEARARELEKDKGLIASSPLYGLPIGIKDVYMTKGMRTTAGSKILQNFTATYTATAVENLIKAGVIVVGKNNCDEFAMGGSCENSAFYSTRNPYDLSKVPGGSSGGSAAAVAAGQVVFSLGSDTGGSIRQPAAFCGTVALKPTYGLISRYGLIAMASSLDSVGPITKTVEDAAYVYNALVSYDPKDSTSHNRERQDYTEALNKDVRGMKVGIPRQANIHKLDKKLQVEIDKVKSWLKESGVEVVDIDLLSLEKTLAAYYIIMPAEVSSNLARFDGIRYGSSSDKAKDLLSYYMNTRGEYLGDEVKRRIMIGTYVLSSGYIDAYYVQAQKVRRLILNDCEKSFSEVDAILLPTTPSTAFALGEKVNDPLDMYLLDIYTVTANLVGAPTIAVPSGLVDGMPYGIQLMGAHFNEDKLISLANQIEKRRGKLTTPIIN